MSLKTALPTPLRHALRDVRDAARTLALRGDDVACPVCDNTFRRFMPATDRPNAVCPRCHSYERHRRLVLFLQRHTDLYSAPLKVLHIAPELGVRRHLRALRNLDYLSGDLTVSDADVRVDVTDIDFPDNSFDVLICSHVLEHVSDDDQGMRELLRVLRPDGWAIIDVPTKMERAESWQDPTAVTPEDKLRVYGHHDHVRFYGRNFPDLLRAQGWKVEMDPFPFSEEDKRRYALSDLDHIYWCRK